MKTFSRKYLYIILIIIISICLISSLVACKNLDADNEDEENQGAPGDSNTMMFNPIEVTDSINWSENTDYTVIPVQYSNATIAKLAEIANIDNANSLLDTTNLKNCSRGLTNEERERYDLLFFVEENSVHSSFGDYYCYCKNDDENLEICIMKFVFETTTEYNRSTTEEDLTAAQNFYDSLAENPITVNGETLGLTFKHENYVYVGNERGFNYLHQNYVDETLRLTEDEEWAGNINQMIDFISSSGVGEAKLNVVLNSIHSAADRMNEIKTRAELIESLENDEDQDEKYIECIRDILDTIVMNISIDQIALFSQKFIIFSYEKNIKNYENMIEELNPNNSNFDQYLELYQNRMHQTISKKKTIENIPQSQFLILSRILISMFKSSLQLTDMDETKDMYLIIGKGEFGITNIAEILGQEIDALNIGEETMSLLLSTLADIRIIDALFSGEMDNETIFQATEDEEMQEYYNFCIAYDNGTHDALYAIKDNFSALLSIISKVCNAIKNADLSNFDQKNCHISSFDETRIYYVDNEVVTEEEYNQAIDNNQKYYLKILNVALASLTDADYEVIFSNFNAAATTLNNAFVLKGFEAEDLEEDEEVVVPTQEDLIIALKAIVAMTDEDIQNMDEETESDIQYLINDLNIYVFSKIPNIF